MIAFTCATCHKKLSVKDELAGKRVKCPKCGQVAVVPELVGSISPAPQDGTIPGPPADQGQPSSGQPKAASEEATQREVSAHDVFDTVAHEPKWERQTELTDFLAPPQAPDELGRLGPYRVLRVLGAGGMGVVFQAEDPELRRLVALKAMLPGLAASGTAKQRFLREARAAARLKHDHIVTIYQVGEDRGVPFLAMELLDGESLDERLKREGKLPPAEVMRIGRETAHGLAAAHARGLIHRDIKPANLWLEDRSHKRPACELDAPQPTSEPLVATSRVKILDFGLARAADEAAHLTQQGAIVGTPAYMAPEQAAGETIDARCDLFSLGCVLYRLCTGGLPFRGANTISTLRALATEQPPPPVSLNAEVPNELSDLVMQLLAKKPEERPESAQAVAEALREIEGQTGEITPRPRLKARKMKGGGTTLTEAAPTQPARSAKKRLPLPWLLGGGVVGLGVLGLLLLFLLRPGDNEASRERERPEDGLKQAGPLPPKFTNSLGMEFVLVPKGRFLMGGNGGTVGDKEVEIPHDFYLGSYEVTQGEWEAVMGNNPSHFSRAGGGRNEVAAIEDLKRFPVEQVSWDDAQMFLRRVNERTTESGWLYRLPKEAEWEYACRGGELANKLDYGFDYYFEKPSNLLLPGQANFEHGKGLKRTCKVGSYTPNRLGLYDMHGNVWEWCADEIPADPKDPKGASRRVNRGGCWHSASGHCRAADRYAAPPSHRLDDLGLRLARVPVGKEGK